MNCPVSLPVEHHVYGSTPDGFATLFAPARLERSTRLALERRCGYSLPPGADAPSSTTLPTKRTCFMVEGRLAVGRTVYLGVDLTGRRGNYLCHHLLFDPAEAAEAFEDPISLIAALEAAGAFLDAMPSDWSELPSSVELVADSISSAPLSDDLLRALLTVCFGWDQTQAPAVVIGDDDTFRNLLSAALRALPPTRRWALPFDSYVFGADWRGLAFVGLPAEREYARGLAAWSLRVDAVAGAWEWRKQIAEAPIVGYFSATKAVPVKQRIAVATVVDRIERQDWRNLVRELGSLDERSTEVVYASYREPLLAYLATSGNAAAAAQFAASMSPADVEFLATFDAFQTLAAVPGIRSLMASAALGSGPMSSLLPWIARDPSLVDQLLRALDRALISPSGLRVVESLVRLVSPDDSDSLYRIFGSLEAACRMRSPDPAATASLIGVIRELPFRDAALAGTSLYILGCLGDVDAFDRLLAAREIAVPTFATSPKLLSPVLRTRLRSNAELRKPLEMLVVAVERGSLTVQVFRSACDEILRDERLEAKVRKRFARDLEAALGEAARAPWADQMLGVCTDLLKVDGHALFHRKDKS